MKKRDELRNNLCNILFWNLKFLIKNSLNYNVMYAMNYVVSPFFWTLAHCRTKNLNKTILQIRYTYFTFCNHSWLYRRSVICFCYFCCCNCCYKFSIPVLPKNDQKLCLAFPLIESFDINLQWVHSMRKKWLRT